MTFYIGSKRKIFQVHKALVCQSAPFFEKAFNGPFQEGQEGVMHLPEDNTESFSMFVHWLYRSTIPEGNSQEYLNNLYHLYSFSEKITPCLDLADKTLHYIQDVFRIFRRKMDRSTLVLVYENTLQHSVLRKFCVHVMVYDYFREWKKLRNRNSNILDKDTLSYVWELGRIYPDFYLDFMH